MKTYTVAVLGATGAVGQEMMKILEERNFPVGQLIPSNLSFFFFTSERTSLLHLHPLAVWREEGTTLSQRGHRAYQERKAP